MMIQLIKNYKLCLAQYINNFILYLNDKLYCPDVNKNNIFFRGEEFYSNKYFTDKVIFNLNFIPLLLLFFRSYLLLNN